jgi:hypothetical protein
MECTPVASLNKLTGHNSVCAECVVGMTVASNVTCATGRSNLTLVDPSYTCNDGYYIASPPVYCAGVCTNQTRTSHSTATFCVTELFLEHARTEHVKSRFPSLYT